MSRAMRVQAWWWAMFIPYAVLTLIFEPFTRLGVPVWAAFAIGAVVGLLLRVLAEYIVFRREMAESTRRFKAAWRKAMDDPKPPTVIE